MRELRNCLASSSNIILLSSSGSSVIGFKVISVIRIQKTKLTYLLDYCVFYSKIYCRLHYLIVSLLLWNLDLWWQHTKLFTIIDPSTCLGFLPLIVQSLDVVCSMSVHVVLSGKQCFSPVEWSCESPPVLENLVEFPVPRLLPGGAPISAELLDKVCEACSVQAATRIHYCFPTSLAGTVIRLT